MAARLASRGYGGHARPWSSVTFEIRLVMDAVLPYKFIYGIKNWYL